MLETIQSPTYRIVWSLKKPEDDIVEVLIPFWGMLGLWTNRIGYHNRVCVRPHWDWEFTANSHGVGILLLQCVAVSCKFPVPMGSDAYPIVIPDTIGP
jgi:hypothetical protein